MLIATMLVAGFFAYVYSIKRQTYLLIWTGGWTLFGLHYLTPALGQGTPSTSLENALNHWLYALSGILFFLGAQLYSQRQIWKVPAVFAAVGLGLWAMGNASGAFSISVVLPASAIYLGVAVVFWQESRKQ